MVVAGEILKECSSGGEEERRDKCRIKEKVQGGCLHTAEEEVTTPQAR